MPDILTERRGNALWVILNRPKKYNAITSVMFLQLKEIFEKAATDDDVSFVVYTGGKCKLFSAGSDFSPAQLSHFDDSKSHGYKLFIDTLIRFEKPVIALVNGPALGIMVTSLALMDAVIAADNATFLCPFSELGLCPEAASSLTFVATMGHQKAASLALFAEKFTAQEAFIAGLVTKIIPADKFESETNKIIERYSKLSSESMKVGKRLLRPETLMEKLEGVNAREEKHINRRFTSEDAIERLTAKFVGGSKL
ncbi:unnamed protein product [Caenorhabditis bovis]|uniref:Uncharacterized protein n=1 Tax=Caenorhabditis bovis TaxID=2654633 RepID=A0A8S1ENZ9_9PELO|nr:unnamed protein product [Caenorhabditis bovis]